MKPMPVWRVSASGREIRMTENLQDSAEIDPIANQPSKVQWVLILVFGVVTVCGIALFVTGGAFTAYSFFNQQPAKATEEEVPPAVAVVDENLIAYQAAADWPVLLFDAFDDNQNEWIDGEIDDDYATILVTIDGTYIWDVTTSKQGFTWRVWPTIDELSDFYLAVDVQNRSDNADAQYGLIFRNQHDDYYYLEVRDGQYFRFFLYESYQWKELLPYTFSDAIRPGDVNHLAVLSQNDQFTLWINDQFVGAAKGSSPAQGQVGVIIGLSYEDEESYIVFDNFEVRIPEIPE
jgi:hypothetical protein